MNYDNLTNYDKYVLSQNNYRSARVFADSMADEYGINVAENTEKEEDLYEQYLLKELRRTTPSNSRILRREEFESGVQPGEAVASCAYYNNSDVFNFNASETEEKRKNVFTKKAHSKVKFPKLTKLGKIVLAVYVIMIVAIASILIVSNTTVTDVNFHESANASVVVEEEENPSVIRAMTIEEEEQTDNGNWFDKLCDSLNNR